MCARRTGCWDTAVTAARALAPTRPGHGNDVSTADRYGDGEQAWRHLLADRAAAPPGDGCHRDNPDLTLVSRHTG